jgi:hypothetical protein
LNFCASAGIGLSVDGGGLRISDPRKVVTPKLRYLLGQRSGELMILLTPAPIESLEEAALASLGSR